jgi:DNA-binding beta-propeller fold protein YncE
MSDILAVISQSGCSLSFFDLSTNSLTGTIPNLLAEPHELCFDSKRNLLYISHTYRHGHFWVHGACSHEISVVDIATKKVVDVIDTRPALCPHGLIMDTDRDILYSSFEEHETGSGGGIIGINLSSRKVVKTINSSTKSHWFVITPDGKKIYTCNKTARFISILDVENEKMVGKIEVPGSEEPSISLDGRYAYFPTPGGDLGAPTENPEVVVIDTETDQIVHKITLDMGPQATHVTSKGEIMVVQFRFEGGLPKEGQLSLYEQGSYKFLGSVDTGVLPLTLKSSPDGKTGFVANMGAGTVSVVDLEKMVVKQTLVVDRVLQAGRKFVQGAHGMAFLF